MTLLMPSNLHATCECYGNKRYSFKVFKPGITSDSTLLLFEETFNGPISYEKWRVDVTNFGGVDFKTDPYLTVEHTDDWFTEFTSREANFMEDTRLQIQMIGITESNTTDKNYFVTPLALKHQEGQELFIYFFIQLSPMSDDSGGWNLSFGKLFFDGITFTDEIITTVPYQPDQHAYLSLREENGSLFAETSQTGEVWTELGSTEFIGDIMYNVDIQSNGTQATEPRGGLTFSVDNVLWKKNDSSAFLGVLDNVISDVEYTIDINKAGGELDVHLAIPPDELPDFVKLNNNVDIFVFYGCSKADSLQTCNDLTLTDCAGDEVLFCTSHGEPHGKRKFSGFISKIRKEYGGDDTTTITLLSHGEELDNYVLEVEGGNPDFFIDQNTGGNIVLLDTTHSFESQTFTVSQTITINAVDIFMKWHGDGSSDLNLTISDNFGNTVSSVDIKLFDTTLGIKRFRLLDDLTLDPGTYTISVGKTFGFVAGTFDVYYSGANPYSGGNRVGFPTQDLRFRVAFLQKNFRITYNSQDPANIALSVLDNYNQQGGTITAGEVVPTGTVVSYTFNENTTFECLDKIIELCPSNYWWTVDIGTNKYILKPKDTEPTHIFTLGKHIQSFELEETIEDLVNIVYFTGGEKSNGENLFIIEKDDESLRKWRRGLERMNDSRVTREDSARLLARGEIDRNKDVHYRTQLVINDGIYDIELIELGQVVAFSNFKDETDDFELQIVSIQYTPDTVTLELDSIPRFINHRLEDLRRNFIQSENQNNPN